jgi:hypothetical protein
MRVSFGQGFPGAPRVESSGSAASLAGPSISVSKHDNVIPEPWRMQGSEKRDAGLGDNAPNTLNGSASLDDARLIACVRAETMLGSEYHFLAEEAKQR